jgi:hypothetical protein
MITFICDQMLLYLEPIFWAKLSVLNPYSGRHPVLESDHGLLRGGSFCSTGQAGKQFPLSLAKDSIMPLRSP